ncbi:MAG: hypothetical protein QOE14_3001, partial [Humisphaera sp.]|nr:hypothetical protein [Humisphaera sp.]
MRDAMLTASWQAGGLAVIVWLVTVIAGRWISARWRCMLWSLVFIRLVMPALPPSPSSLLNLRPAALTNTPMTVNVSPEELVTFGVMPDVNPLRSANIDTPVARRITWSQALTIVWLIVAGMLVLRMTFACALLSIRLRRLSPSTDARLVELLRNAAIAAFETDLVTSPALLGVFRPRLLLPVGLVDRLTRDELRFIILHELAHLRRRDILVGAIVALITALHWFNPLVWLAAARFRSERELACDEAVLAATSPEARPAYGATILRLLELFPQPPGRRERLIGAVGVVSSSRRTLRRRIALIAAPRQRFSPLGPILLIVLALGALTGPRIRAAAAPSPPTAAPSPTAAATTTTSAPND